MGKNNSIKKHRYIYRAYAALYRLGCFKKKSSRNKNKSVGAFADNSPISSYDEMIEIAEVGEGSIYGKRIIEEYDNDNSKSILLVSHDLTMSGAPIVLLNFAEVLKNNGWQVVIITPVDGDVGEYAANNELPVIVFPELFESNTILRVKDLFSAIVVNTIICAPIINMLNGCDCRVMWWIHEAESIYNRQVAKIMPGWLSDNVYVYCMGTYARKMLSDRYPRYKTALLLCCVKDLIL